MKELSTEEKAKRYDEAIKKAKDMLSYKEVRREDMEYLFPELKESEDEKIRKALIEMVHDTTGDSLWVDYNVHKEDALAWLEKQGKNNMGISEATKQNLEDNLNKALEKETSESCNEFLDEQILANSAKTCKDEQKPAWSEEDRDYFDAIIAKLEVTQDDAALTNNQMEYLKSLRNRVQLKQEWSEEDDKIRSSIIDFIRYELNHSAYIGTAGVNSAQQIEWLESLKDRVIPQSHWKPSDEQMDALRYVTNFDYGGHKATLVSLYEQLKKLK